MASKKLDRLRAEAERKRAKEMRSRKRAFLLGFLVLCLLLGKMLYDTFAPKPVGPPTPYEIRVVHGDEEGMSHVDLLFFRPDPIEDSTSFEAQTDPQGRYRLPKERWNGDWICQTTGEDGVRSQGFVGDFEPAKGFVEMEGTEQIPGRVENKRGEPLVGAHIEVRHRMNLGPPLAEVTSDSKGAFVIDHISSSLKVLSFRVHKEGYQLTDIEVDFHGDEGLVLQIARGRPLVLDVELPDGSPAADLEVSLPGLPFLPRRTDKQGRARFEGLIPGHTYKPRIAHPTYTYLLPPALYPSRRPLTVKLAKPLVLEGWAKDRQGHPLIDLLLTHYHGPWPRRTCRTDPRGYFRLEGLPPGKVRLHYNLPGGEPAVYELLMRKDIGQPILKLW